ncbi:ryanodine receptor-like [Mizuhopecten yessoensis]|uniref:ryanodine receptor-like n=1 Tax=Mizuhopecten yessoensis TaxID=6573 RepID=UPI000B45BEA2|nr:ryanodine receptor-like [Mizuhopecten yessoensis]
MFVLLQMCRILQHLCNLQLRHRVESIISFSDQFVGDCQNDQLRRYQEIKQSNLSSAVTARITKEFRCPPHEQMRNLLAFKTEEDADPNMPCPCREDLKDRLVTFHENLLNHCAMPTKPEDNEGGEMSPEEQVAQPSSTVGEKLLKLVWKSKEEEQKPEVSQPTDGKIGNACVFSQRFCVLTARLRHSGSQLASSKLAL